MGIVVESREDAEPVVLRGQQYDPGRDVGDLGNRPHHEPPELRVEILGRPVSDEQEEAWRKQLAFTHSHIALSVYRTSIDEADIEDLQNQVQQLMMSD